MSEPSNFFHKMGLNPNPDFSTETERRLREAFEAFVAECPFQAGMMVRPRDIAPVIPRGPHIVLEVVPRDTVDRLAFMDGCAVSMARLNMRVAGVCGDNHVHPYWTEHWMFEKHIGIPIIGQKP